VRNATGATIRRVPLTPATVLEALNMPQREGGTR
jgi:CO/xanthine dehydrogenase Mo-binding subunit